jgi:antigen flippase
MPSIAPDFPVTPRVALASQLTALPTGAGNTYGPILRSSLLIGASSGFNISIGLVRTKAMALLLGPAGFGLMGLYTSILTLAQAIAGMGINQSGVRHIAQAVGSGDAEHVARTATVLRWSSVVLGLLGGLLLLALCRPVSTLTFGNDDHAYPVALLSLAVLLQTVSNGHGALLQGLRRIADLAKSGALGAFLGTSLTILFVYLFREQGILPSLIATAGVSLLLSWWFSRAAIVEAPALSPSQIANEARPLLTLGLAFFASGILTMGAAYVVRILIVRQISLEAAGLYQSAWTVGGMYVGFILQAMGTDFYPRLAAVVTDHDECNRLVNEQTHVGLLLAGPGILATLTLAPLVMSLFYSSAFRDAADILRWICLGTALQVITWPMGFIIVAASRQRIFFWSEVAYSVLYLGMAWVLVRYLGLNGAGIAFFASYVLHGIMVYPIVRWLTGFRWSAANARLGAVFLALIGFVFCSSHLLPFSHSAAFGTLAALLSGVYSARALVALISPHHLPHSVHRLLVCTRMAPRRTP